METPVKGNGKKLQGDHQKCDPANRYDQAKQCFPSQVHRLLDIDKIQEKVQIKKAVVGRIQCMDQIVRYHRVLGQKNMKCDARKSRQHENKQLKPEQQLGPALCDICCSHQNKEHKTDRRNKNIADRCVIPVIVCFCNSWCQFNFLIIYIISLLLYHKEIIFHILFFIYYFLHDRPE